MTQLAIIIPYYKIDFFEETIQSVVAQTDKRFTLYIGNDASPNDPKPILDKYLKPNEYEYFDYKENLGGQNLALQWERILENVTEEWFQILGDDDVISNNFVEEFHNNLPEIEKEKVNVIKTKRRTIDENGNYTSDFTSYNQLINVKDYFSDKILHGARSSLSEHIFRTISYHKFGFRHFPMAWASDDAAILEISDGKPIFFMSSAGVLVRISSENISGRQDNLQQKQDADLIYQKFLINTHYNKISKEALTYLVNMQIYHNYHYSIPLGFSLFKAYLRLGKLKKIITLPKTWFILLYKK